MGRSHSDKSAKECIGALAREFLPRHGNPLKIINDNGQGFRSNEWARFLGQAKIELSKITPGHPQGNAKVERLNKTLKSVLAKAIENHPERWSEKVGFTLATYISAVQPTPSQRSRECANITPRGGHGDGNR